MGKKNKKKAKKQAFISGIIRDGRVTKKEAKKASKQGISLARIRKAQTKSFKPNNVFSNAKVSREPSRMAPRQFRADETLPARFSNNIARRYQQEHGGLGTYSPLVVQGAAQKIFDQGTGATAPTPQTGGATTDAGQTNAGQTDGGGDDMGFDTSYYDDLIAGQDQTISDLNMRIGDLTNTFQTQLGQMTTAMEQERADAAAAMQEMQGNFAQAMAQRGNRARVQGIRFADRGTGGATQAQLARRGLRGTFGRRGERLMKISSLNV